MLRKTEEQLEAKKVIATVYRWEGGKDNEALRVGLDKDGLMRNQFLKAYRMIYNGHDLQVLEICPPAKYVLQAFNNEQKRIKKKQLPHWPADKLALTRVDNVQKLEYITMSPFAKLWVVSDGMEQNCQIVPRDATFTPPEEPLHIDWFV